MIEEMQITYYDPSIYIRAGQVRWTSDKSCIVYTLAKIHRKLHSECWTCIVLWTKGNFDNMSCKQNYPGLVDDKWIWIDQNDFILDTNEDPIMSVF
jgi:hypothetical protein